MRYRLDIAQLWPVWKSVPFLQPEVQQSGHCFGLGRVVQALRPEIVPGKILEMGNYPATFDDRRV